MVRERIWVSLKSLMRDLENLEDEIREKAYAGITPEKFDTHGYEYHDKLITLAQDLQAFRFSVHNSTNLILQGIWASEGR